MISNQYKTTKDEIKIPDLVLKDCLNQLNIGLNHLKYLYDDDRVNDLLFNLEYSRLSFIEAKKILRKYYSQEELKALSLMINKVKFISKMINGVDGLNVEFFEFIEALKTDDLEK